MTNEERQLIGLKAFYDYWFEVLYGEGYMLVDSNGDVDGALADCIEYAYDLKEQAEAEAEEKEREAQAEPITKEILITKDLPHQSHKEAQPMTQQQQTFTKADLQTGMIVTLADNSYWWVVRNVPNANLGNPVSYLREVTGSGPDFTDLGNYTEDLLWDTTAIPDAYKENFADQNIIKVSRYHYAYDVLTPMEESELTYKTTTLWERNPRPTFTKQDLQTGMMVQTRRGFYYHVFLGDLLRDQGTLKDMKNYLGIDLSDLDDNLLNTFNGPDAALLDVMKVWIPETFYDLADTDAMLANGTLIWTRQPE